MEDRLTSFRCLDFSHIEYACNAKAVNGLQDCGSKEDRKAECKTESLIVGIA